MKIQSKINTVTTNNLTEIINKSSSISSVLRKLGYKQMNSGIYRTFKRRITRDDIDISHFKNKITHKSVSIHTKETFISALKTRTRLNASDKINLMKFNIIPFESCDICGQSRIWNNNKLTLQVDHINGDSTNNNPNNLRFICPNCHTQTETFGVGNRIVEPLSTCKLCKSIISKGAQTCIHCAGKFNPQKRKFDITEEKLRKLIWEIPSEEIAKLYGVSGTTVKKWCKIYDIDKPHRGYWQKRKAQK